MSKGTIFIVPMIVLIKHISVMIGVLISWLTVEVRFSVCVLT